MSQKRDCGLLLLVQQKWSDVELLCSVYCCRIDLTLSVLASYAMVPQPEVADGHSVTTAGLAHIDFSEELYHGQSYRSLRRGTKPGRDKDMATFGEKPN